MINIPNLLTLFRIALIPVLVASFYVGGDTGRWLAFAVFVLAGATDFLDGYFARRLDQRSALGRFLDPVADKLVVAAALLMMVGFGQIGGLSVLPALVILCREILVSGLREYLAGIDVSVPVSRLAKWKTAIQMTAIAILLLGGAGPWDVPWATIGEAGLWAAAVLTLVTGYDYLRSGLRHIAGADAGKGGIEGARAPESGAGD
ncbi:MAG: CDP-diacylglycerol--glycerol-3-phosphate 3-phosphatidyltransferase [Defluviicoccus sp.]|nr:CDP-diacylglycerol--glycerol-3-phosphate 3-phosphatidyltransferase [Defluviicoccus sp.]MDE0386084.1 CDP-diacylglycerol--glycerol-3-phosphate 3-phosphatidyltransferase [Defluviicoccus sp.]